MEYIGQNSLFTFLKTVPNRRLCEGDCVKIGLQILQALKYLHDKEIIHRDIKLENILVDERMNIKLIDFGFSICIAPEKTVSVFCGTPSYMAPEII